MTYGNLTMRTDINEEEVIMKMMLRKLMKKYVNSQKVLEEKLNHKWRGFNELKQNKGDKKLSKGATKCMINLIEVNYGSMIINEFDYLLYIMNNEKTFIDEYCDYKRAYIEGLHQQLIEINEYYNKLVENINRMDDLEGREEEIYEILTSELSHYNNEKFEEKIKMLLHNFYDFADLFCEAKSLIKEELERFNSFIYSLNFN